MSSTYRAPPLHTSYILRNRLNSGHQQELGRYPNWIHPGLVPLSFMIFTHVILGWINPSSNRSHHGCFDLRRSKTVEVRLTASIIEKRIKNSSSSTGLVVIGGSAAASGSSRDCCCCWAITSASTIRSSSVKSLQSTTIPSCSSTSPSLFMKAAILFRF